MAKKLIIFDCDGTLTDSESMNNLATVDALHECGLTHYDLDFCQREFVGMTMTAVKAFVEEREGKKIPDNFQQRFVHFAGERKKSGLLPIEGALEAVDSLCRTYDVCVGSNGERSLVFTSLQMVGLFDVFGEDRIFTRIQVSRGKPFPELFLFAAEKTGFAPRDCLVIEDSSAGVQAGVAAGMHTIGLTAASHDKAHTNQLLLQAGATAVFDTWAEIVNYIKTNVDG